MYSGLAAVHNEISSFVAAYRTPTWCKPPPSVAKDLKVDVVLVPSSSDRLLALATSTLVPITFSPSLSLLPGALS